MVAKETPKVENNYSLKTDDEKILELLRVVGTQLAIQVTPAKALAVSSVFACVNVIARALGVLPVEVRRKIPDGSEVVTNIPLHYVLSTASSYRVPSMSMIMAMVGNLVLRGNGYAWLGRDGNNQVNEMVALEAMRMRFNPAENKDRPYIYAGADGSVRYFAEDEIFHVRNFGLTGGMGIDNMAQCREIIALAIALDTNASSFFGNSSRMGSTFETDRSLPADYRATLEARLAEKHEGPENAYRSLILENGLKQATARFDNTSSQFDESRKRQSEEIARYFGVPPHKIGILNNIPRANAEEQAIEFVTGTVLTYTKLLESTIAAQILTPVQVARGYYVKFNVNGLLRGNMRDRFAAYQIGRFGGWLSVNEIREWEDLNSIGPDGDIYLQPANMIEAGEEPEDAAAPEIDNNNRQPANHYAFLRNQMDVTQR